MLTELALGPIHLYIPVRTDTFPLTLCCPGSLVIPAIIPRLPFGSNHLGISESTTVALLVLLMEVCANSGDNARWDTPYPLHSLSLYFFPPPSSFTYSSIFLLPPSPFSYSYPPCPLSSLCLSPSPSLLPWLTTDIFIWDIQLSSFFEIFNFFLIQTDIQPKVYSLLLKTEIKFLFFFDIQLSSLLILYIKLSPHLPSSVHIPSLRLFRHKEGIPYLTRLSRSRQHTTKIVFAANKVSNSCQLCMYASCYGPPLHYKKTIIWCLPRLLWCPLLGVSLKGGPL